MKQLTLLALSLFLIFGCSSEEPGPVVIPDDFDLASKWVFTHVEIDATVAGLPQSGSDDNPIGYVEFFEDGTGFSEYSFEVLGFPLAESANITWEREGNTVTLNNLDNGLVDVWTILAVDNNNIQAQFDREFSSLNRGTLTADMIRE
ncbi:MAG: hypothetical protein HKN09_02485 [Saprospiraceae bacterium]|nr:hypothetical protein [Saprospiraceae bacterium]